MNISQEHLRSSTSVDIGSEEHVYLKKKTVDHTLEVIGRLPFIYSRLIYLDLLVLFLFFIKIFM